MRIGEFDRTGGRIYSFKSLLSFSNSFNIPFRMSGASKAIRLYLFNSVIQSQLPIFFNTYMARRWMFAQGIGEKRGKKSMVYHNFDYLCSRFLVGRRDISPANRSDKRPTARGNKKMEIGQAQNQCQAIKVSARGFFYRCQPLFLPCQLKNKVCQLSLQPLWTLWIFYIYFMQPTLLRC